MSASGIEVMVIIDLEVIADFGSQLLEFPYLLDCHPPLAIFGKEGPCGIVVYSPIGILSHWTTLLTCTLVVNTLHHFSLHRRVGMLWSKLHRVSTCSKVGIVLQ